jgi:Na+/H+ antiporter NhaD/arsenite permease-like protein
VIGIVLLIVGAELLVRGASKLAVSFGIVPLVVGLTVSLARRSCSVLVALLLMVLSAGSALAAEAVGPKPLNLTSHWTGITCLLIFGVAYLFVMLEERVHLRKSIPVIIAAGGIWVLVAVAYGQAGVAEAARDMVRHNLLEFAELFLFILAAVTFVNTMEERQVFDALRAWLIRRGFSLRALFWMTGLMAFLISPIADNLTTTLVMGAVVISIGGGNVRFVTAACVNIVVAANAGGAFSPFGDITTLMVWQKGVVPFTGFFALFFPSLVNWLVPAGIMSFTIGRERPSGEAEATPLRPGAFVVVGLFLSTITGTVLAHNFLDLPPVLGMMTGLGVLKLYGHTLERAALRARTEKEAADDTEFEILYGLGHSSSKHDSFDIFQILQRVEWDTLMFFYGVILCVGGLGALGYLALLSQGMYQGLGPTGANTLVGLLSAIVDNIPVMFAVLSMNPDMSRSQWLLVTLTAGVGGSLLSIGSAAGVALMGQAKGAYTFVSHLKWTWAVALGYAASIGIHLLISGK